MEIAGITLGWQAVAGVAGAVWAAWRTKKVASAAKRVRKLYAAVVEARSESSPGGRQFTQEEVETVMEEFARTVIELSPWIARLIGVKR